MPLVLAGPGALRRHVVQFLAIVVVAGQMVCAHHLQLTPWRGGGFGMFAVVDSPTSRYLVAEGAGTDGITYRIQLPVDRFSEAAFREEFLERLRASPDEAGLLRLGNALVQAEYRPTPLNPLPARLSRISFATALATLRRHPMAEVVAPVRRGTAVGMTAVQVRLRRLVVEAGVATFGFETIRSVTVQAPSGPTVR